MGDRLSDPRLGTAFEVAVDIEHDTVPRTDYRLTFPTGV